MPFGSRSANAAFLVACLTLAYAYAVFLLAPAVGTFHDDGVYAVTAQALAEGRGYRIISAPGEPVQTKYPILFPWLVSLFWRVHSSFPDNLVWLRLVPLGASAVWLWLTWLLLRRLDGSRETAAIVLLLTAASPWVVFLSTTFLAETLFAAVLTGGLLIVSRIWGGEGRRFDGLVAGILMGAAMLTRTAGSGPAVAGLIALGMQRQWFAAAQYSIAMVVLVAPWVWWVSQNPPAPGSDPFYSTSNYGAWNIIASYDWSDKLAVLRSNVVYTLMSVGEFWGFTVQSRLGLGAVLMFCVCAIRGLWLMRATPLAILVGTYYIMLLAWAWPPGRFLVPVLPLLIWLAFVGARPLKRLALVVALPLLIPAAFELRQLVRETQRYGATWFAAGDPDDWQEMTRQLEWVARETPSDAVLTGVNDPTYFLFTGRKALRADILDPLRLFYGVRGPADRLRTAEEFRQRLIAMGADYVIVKPRDGVAPLVTAVLNATPGSLTPVAGSEATGYVIYQVEHDRLITASPGGSQ